MAPGKQTISKSKIARAKPTHKTIKARKPIKLVLIEDDDTPTTTTTPNLTKIDLSKKKHKSKSPIKSIMSDTQRQPILQQPQQQPTTLSLSPPYNDALIQLMETLYKIMFSQGEPFRARAYKKAQETLMSFSTPITNIDMLKGKPHIGETILNKMRTYVETGTLKMIEREKENPVNIFTEIYGVGPKKAKELVVKHQIKTIDQLRKNQDLLNDKQKIGLRYYEDILKRIPRSEITDFEKLFSSVHSSLASFKKDETTFEIVGSYRRKAKDSGDIDVIITDKKNNKKIFKEFIDELIKKDVIIEVLSRGPTKSLVIGRLSTEHTPRRIDFLYATPEEYPFAILYFTGSATFNTVMRQRALNLGYSMNEHGMYKMVGKTKGNLISQTFETERDIFDFLGLQYKKPEDRIDGTSVVVVEDKPDKPTKPTKPDKPTKLVKKTKKLKKLVLIDDDKQHVSVPKTSTKAHIKQFSIDGITYLKQLPNATLDAMLTESNKAYYNSKPLLSDNQYDILKEHVEKVNPSSTILQTVGAPLEIEREKVKLPYFMGSMDKIKPDTGALTKWKHKYKGDYVLSAKLDGISALYVCENGTKRLYTRGDGVYGQDITYLIPYLKLPLCNIEESIVVRGELIMSKELFTSKYGDKASARNLVSGIVNSKKSATKEKFNDVDFVAYELIKPSLEPREQFEFLRHHESVQPMNVVIYKHVTEEDLQNESLSELLVEWRDSYKYEIDGVIVAHNKMYERKTGNPEHAFAFKMMLTDQIVEAKVLDVIWAPSKHGYLKPRIQIEPVVIGGARIEFATAFNGAYVEENKIGIGAMIRLIRSGDVIPHILSVIEPAPTAKMPDVDYKWNDTHVDILLVDASSDSVVKEKTITAFFVGLGVSGLSSGNIKRILKAGFSSIEQILSMTISDFLTVDGFKEKMATKVHSSIQTMIDTLSIVKILSVANIFGRGMGERRLKAIFKEYPDILINTSMTTTEKIASVASLSGFAIKTAKAFVDKIPNAVDFLHRTQLIEKYNTFVTAQTKPKASSSAMATSKTAKGEAIQSKTPHPLQGKRVLLTGFRSKELEKSIEEVGGEIATSVSKKVAYVIVRDMDESTGKADKARKLGVQLILEDDFIKKYIQST